MRGGRGDDDPAEVFAPGDEDGGNEPDHAADPTPGQGGAATDDHPYFKSSPARPPTVQSRL